MNFFQGTLIGIIDYPDWMGFCLFVVFNLCDKELKPSFENGIFFRKHLYQVFHIFPIYSGFKNLVRKVETIQWTVRRRKELEIRQGNIKRNKELGQG